MIMNISPLKTEQDYNLGFREVRDYLPRRN